MSNLQYIEIPSSVSVIGASAFYSCINLKTVKIGNGAMSIGANAFANCTTLFSVTIGTGLKTISANSFSNMPVGSIIKIDMPTDSIAGAPWGATNATVIWNDTP